MTPAAPNTCAVLFEGAGGSTEGLRNAGYETIGYEFWATAVETAIANQHVSRLHDLSDASLDHLIEPAEVLWASSPCQPFSVAGDGEGEFDDRDGFPWALRILANMLPKVAFFENVKGLTFQKHSAYFAGVLATIRTLGYDAEWKVLNCADYGVPQTRERCIIIARRDGGRIVWPMPTHTEQPGMFTEQWVSVLDALPHLPSHLGIGYWRGQGMIERHRERPLASVGLPAPTVHGRSEHNWHLAKVMGAGMVERHGDRPVRDMDEPAFTVRADGGGNAPGGFVLHYRQNQPDGTPITCDLTDRPAPTIGTQSASQWCITEPGTEVGDSPASQEDVIKLTIPELATLQGFPPDYVFTGTKTAQAKLVGNAVPPRLAQVVAEANRPV
jgi:DNA (cytosine-5)-methyltransferase 1